MPTPIADLLGVRGFRFTRSDALFKVPAGVHAVWLSAVGAASEVPGSIGVNGTLPRGFANAPLAVSPGDHIRVRVGGRPELDGTYGLGIFEKRWRMGVAGGWNGGGNGGGGSPPSVAVFGTIVGTGGGGATTFHLIPAGQSPNSTLGDLVAVAPGEGALGGPGAANWTVGIQTYTIPTDTIIIDADSMAYRLASPASFSFAGDPVPDAGSPEFIGDYTDDDTIPPPLWASAPRTPLWHTLGEPWDPPDGFFTSQAVTVGNAGESFRGGHGRSVGDWGTPGGGGGYGGGASGSFIHAEGNDGADFTVDAIQGARHGGFLLPIERPAGWDSGPLVDEDGTILTTVVDDVEAPLLYLPVGSPESAWDPFGIYDFTNDDFIGGDPGTLLGHGSARIQWAKDPKRTRWIVGHVGWGRNNGW